MLLKEKDEVLISSIMSDVGKYFKTQKVKYVRSFREKLSHALETQPNDFIEYIYDLLDTYYENENYVKFVDSQIKDILHYNETKNKQYIVFAIPVLFIGYHSTTDLEFVRKRKYFDNRLFKLKIDLDYILNTKLITKYESNLTIHDSFLDLNQLYQNYQGLITLKNDLYINNKKKISKNSILLNKTNEEYAIEKQDNIKFIIGLIEFDKREDVNESLNNSFQHILEDFKTLKSKFNDLLINQQVATDNLLVLPPQPLMSAIEDGWEEFHFQVLNNLILKVFETKNKHNIQTEIVYIEEMSIIHILFFEQHERKNPFFRIDVQHGVADFEEEIRIITDIMNDIGGSFNVIRK